jgi:hypothetical protein
MKMKSKTAAKTGLPISTSVTVLGLIVATTAMIVSLSSSFQQAYAQAVFYFNGLNQEQQAFIEQALKELENKTADSLYIDGDSGRMSVTWTDNITATAPNGQVFEITQESTLSIPTNFTIANGYEYRDNKIFKPDGTELFAGRSNNNSSLQR